ncbi:5'/3'-nucleotidase SurE [Rivihabitans pingtungensis]|jgi:5'-nucleotidase|uniref:5'-nucleotidase SurE n=1 Tax=Rivihabitans pingtungensis TaxID=1054498 RepID=A0A318KKJ2_9NEIS|nr:5'/3'-nucleotidase SurE [Rivihabitans pingtungensis]MCK6437406.1 5'/3'-nucleotidase SurE [Rivihabitans pingtungensis]PXX78361.1 5'-nucleotidase /3'-nucleotidase /exopolyphosphatase [Rivihabitans pingtungensis]HNX70466.1 5'/3'-nucleotidase SurE [Rivihabitans pingtungensis]
MNFLISNDDGYFAPGLAALAQTLSRLGNVTVVAPERDRSGASNSLTLDRPLTARRAANGFFSVNGTPTDCVHLAITGLMDSPPDMVFSGINHGPNMGDDTLYSGTVAAATEGYLLGIPSVAMSLAGKPGEHFASACLVAEQLVRRWQEAPWAQGAVLLNVNVPDVPPEQLGPWQVTRLGRRHHAEPVVQSRNPRGETIYWVGAVGRAQDAGPGTDFHTVAAKGVSVTPLQLDLTAHHTLDPLSAWLAP